MIWLVLVIALAAMLALYRVGRSRYGHLRLSELPGLAFILLAGASYRRQAAGILASREQRERATEDAASERLAVATFSHAGALRQQDAAVTEIERQMDEIVALAGYASRVSGREYCAQCHDAWARHQ